MTEGVLNETARVATVPVPAAASHHWNPRLWWKLMQMALDGTTVALAGAAGYAVYLASGLGKGHVDPALYLRLDLMGAVLTMFALYGSGEYSGAQGLLRIESVRRIIVAVSAGLGLTLAMSFLIQIQNFSRLTLLIVGPAMVGALAIQRVAMWTAQDRWIRRRRRPVLVYGAGETGRVLSQHLLGEHHLGMVPVGFLDDDDGLHGETVRIGAGTDGERVPVLGDEDDLEAAVRRTGAEAVFLAMPSARADRIAELVASLESRGIRFYCVPGAGDLLFASLSFGQIAGMPVFSRRTPNAARAYDLLKRTVDVAGALALLLLSAPLHALGALLVRVTSPGPILFRQTRIGLRGEPFTIYKLRTMRTECPRYGYHPTDSADDRITPVGRWLRKTSIDELPQLWNILKGDMSLVGPRPEMPFIVEGYDDIQRLRLTVKPGLTGLWQISADRAFEIHHNLHYDLYYVERRSMLLDLAILILTPFVLLRSRRTA